LTFPVSLIYAYAAMSPSILIVEDDRRIAELVAKHLEAAGFQCRQAHDGLTALQEFTHQRPSLIVLDIMIPHLDGLELTRRIRQDSDIPILMLTARSDEGDVVLGFEVGADDYLTKPFKTRELVARVRALLRRTDSSKRVSTLVRGDLRIDPARRAVHRDDTPVTLTTLEFDLLYFLAARPGRVYTREALMAQVWGEERMVDARSIDSLISRLRRKLETDPSAPKYIQTVWGAGYRFPEDIA
jgi:DNA-binding response OmpR family regulator